MKKYYILFVVAAAAMVACNKSEVPSIDGGKNEADQKYVIYAEDVNTRTVTDASFNVTWTNNDNLAVYTWPADQALPEDAAWRAANPVNFIASEGSATPKPFSLSEADSDGSLAVAAGIPYEGRLSAFKDRYGNGSSSLKWGVIYPGKQSNPSWKGYGVIVFGNFELVHSTQNGNNNMAHLAYQDVLWGTATTTAENPVPTISMKHIGTMMEYTVVNETSSPITVNCIKITVNGAAIGGQYRINVFDGSISEYLLKDSEIHTCPLWVDKGEAIPVGGSAKFYQVLAPFKLDSGYKITMTVETDKGTWTNTKAFDDAISFESGKRNPTTLRINAVKEADPTLKTHEDTEVNWFNEGSNLGRYLDMANGIKYTLNDSFKQADVDIVIFRGSSQTALTFAAPSDQALQDYIDNSIKDWTTINDTKVKKVDVDFDSITKLSELQSAYDAASNEDKRCVLDFNETAIVKTVDGNYALIKVIGGEKYEKTDAKGNKIYVWGNFKLSVKTVE